MGELATAYRSFLKENLNPDGLKYAIYDYCTDFEKLWSDVSAGNGSGTMLPKVVFQAIAAEKKALIVIWDDLPQDDGPAKLGPHLTPLDWALAFSTRVIKSGMAGGEQFSIHIVDLTSTRFENSFAVQMAASICEAMPWVKLYAPLPRGRRAYETQFPIQDLQAGTWPEAKIKLPAAPGGKAVERLDKFNQAWRAWVVQSKDHHDVNNVIGPDILSESGERRQGLPGAFLTRLTWSGHDLKQVSDWKPWEAAKAVGDLFGRPLSVLVVDDQLRQGWERFVCRLFGQTFDEKSTPTKDKFYRLNASNRSTQVHVQGCLGSQPLIDFLKNANFRIRDFSKQIRRDKEPSPELILLDLRLYAQVTEAREQARLLLDIVNKTGGGLAWPGIDQNEIKRIDDWCNGAEVAMASDEALLLLPRLLALALPLTPIILFSSTGQAWIRERLKPYQNIFTGFEKPRVLSNPASVEASISALRDGLDEAIKMMRLRLQLAHAQRAGKIAGNKLPADKVRLVDHHVEIYADETRNLEQGITSGVAVCFYPNVDTAEDLQTYLLGEHENARVVWAKNANMPSNIPALEKGVVISKDAEKCKYQVELIDRVLTDVDIDNDKRCLWSVVATRVEGAIPEKNKVSLAAFPDGPLDEALRFNLEFTLFVLIPCFTRKRESFTGDVQIYIPSRRVPLMPANEEESNSLPGFARQLCEAFDLGEPNLGKKVTDRDITDYRKVYPGIQQGWSKPYIYTSSFNHDEKTGSAFPLVRGWLHEWRRAEFDITRQISKVKMTVLGRGDRKGITQNEASQRRLFHDIADWVCAASGKKKLENGNTSTWAWPLKEELIEQKIFPYWFVSTDGTKIKGNMEHFTLDTKNALILMCAIKRSVTGDVLSNSRADVLRIVLRNSYISSCAKRLLTDEYCAQQRLILWALRNEFALAGGRDLHALLADEAGQPTAKAGIPKEQVPSANNNMASRVVEITENEEHVTTGPRILEPEDVPPILLSGDQINSRFPDARQYFTNVDPGDSCGAMFFRAVGSTDIILTHSVTNRKTIQELHLEGWSDPRIVLGKELGINHLNTKTIRVLAAKLANGNWQLFA